MSWLKKFFKFREKSDGDVVKPFLEHMEDLRWTIIKVVSVLVLAMIIAFTFRTDLMRVLQGPLEKVDPKLPGTLIITDIAGSFTLSLTMAFYAGIVIALPFLLYFIAEFVLPALTRQEKKYLFPGIAAGTALFMAGVLVCYHHILPETLRFFFNDALKMGITPMWTWNKYASFCSWMTIGFGLLCEVPVVVMVLAFLGIVNYQLLSTTRPYAVTVILVLAAVVAPTPDPVTFLTLATPVVLLYEACIWAVWLLDRRRLKAAEGRDFPD
jgi:sec-independent protein translocase protein TatC